MLMVEREYMNIKEDMQKLICEQIDDVKEKITS